MVRRPYSFVLPERNPMDLRVCSGLSEVGVPFSRHWPDVGAIRVDLLIARRALCVNTSEIVKPVLASRVHPVDNLYFEYKHQRDFVQNGTTHFKNGSPDV